MFYDAFDALSKIFDSSDPLSFSSITTEEKRYSVPAFPPVRVVQRENKISFKFALAGYKKEDIELNFERDCLVLSTTKEFNKTEEKKKDDCKVIVDNFKTPQFAYKYFVPSDKFDFDKVEATFDNGVLSITIPKKEKVEPKAKKIEIK